MDNPDDYLDDIKIEELANKLEIEKLDALDALEDLDQSSSAIGVQGRAGELGALLNSNRVDLNQVDLSMKGGNFPIYDNIGEDAVSSVKVRGLNDAQLPERTTKAYLKDFRTAIGEGSDPYKFDKSADLLLEAKERRLIPASEEMQQISTREEMQSYLHDHGELQIPADHVAQVQEALRADIREFSENYGLDQNRLTDAQVEQLAQRVKPINNNVTTNTIRDMIETHKELRRASRL